MTHSSTGREPASDDPLFRTTKGTYDCCHAAAATWLRAGVPPGPTARHLGRSVETLVSTYVGALEGDEELGNQRIETELGRGSTSAAGDEHRAGATDAA